MSARLTADGMRDDLRAGRQTDTPAEACIVSKLLTLDVVENKRKCPRRRPQARRSKDSSRLCSRLTHV